MPQTCPLNPLSTIHHAELGYLTSNLTLACPVGPAVRRRHTGRPDACWPAGIRDWAGSNLPTSSAALHRLQAAPLGDHPSPGQGTTNSIPRPPERRPFPSSRPSTFVDSPPLKVLRIDHRHHPLCTSTSNSLQTHISRILSKTLPQPLLLFVPKP